MKKLLRGILFLSLLAIVVVLGIVFLRPNLIISKEDAKKELALPASHFVKWQGAELHYVDEGSGIPVLVIHGFGGSTRNFSKVAALLKDSFRVVRVDLPGFGLSDFPDIGDKPDYVKMYRDYITFILDTLHLDSVYVMGNSMGGGIAWLAAADHPTKVKKLILLNSAGYDVTNVSGKLTMFKYKSFGHVFDKGMPMFMSKSGMLSCYADSSKVEEAVWKLNNHFSNREGNIQNMLTLARAQQFPDTNLIKLVQCPTLIIWGKQDRVIPVEHAESFHHDIKNSKVIIYDPCGHTPMMECPEKVAKDFLEFVRN
ncbi:MAG: alpha/beta hydrolase [Bacteroidota bacterium]|nr:alpha/beta hydrolase [Bacteroidota bacterium]